MWAVTHKKMLALTSVPLLLALSACGGSYGYSNTAAKTSASTSHTGGPGLAVARTSLGKVLVDGKGMTVYVLSADQPGRSTCDSTCLAFWPPVAALAKASQPAGVTGALGTARTTSGGRMEAVGGAPLYTFVEDHAPGDVNGEGLQEFGGTWYAVSPSGHPVTASGSTSSGSSGGSGSSSGSAGSGGRY
jgi:predicted lipoprotein with Yx(FWY)xxD motif